jgi:Domain of unknown function (DUF4159)
MRNPLITVLAGLMAIAILAPPAARAQAVKGDPAEEYGVRIARLKYGGGGDWYTGPSTVPNWLREFERRTGVKTFKEEKVVTLTDENLRAYPFLYMTGHGTIKLTREERDALRAYLDDGGFLFANDSYGLDGPLRAMVREVFPDHPFEEISADHPIFHCFYDLPGLPKIHEHDKKPPQAFGVTVDGRLVLFYVYESDIGDGLEDPDVHHDPPAKQEEAMKMATNILMYALTQAVLL